MAEHRKDRVAHLIQAELARLLLREAHDPRLQAVTITAVRVTADLRVAHVYFRTLTIEATPHETERALARAMPFLRSGLGRTLGMRVTPELRFEYDTTPDSARRVDSLLDEMRRESEEDGEDDQ